MALNVPELPQMRPLALQDRETLSPLLRALEPQRSELTFTNLFMWREAYQVRVCRVGGAVALLSWREDPEDSFLLPPLGEGADAEVVRRCLEHLAGEGHHPRLCRVTGEDVARLGLDGERFEIKLDRDQWDYVCLVRDLIELGGNWYHGKRNHLEQFVSRHAFRYLPLTQELVAQWQELQDRWCDEKHCDLVSTLRAESRAVKEVLATSGS